MQFWPEICIEIPFKMLFSQQQMGTTLCCRPTLNPTRGLIGQKMKAMFYEYHSMVRITTLFVFFAISLIPGLAMAQRDVPAYIKRYDSVAVDIMLEHQFPASLVLGLAIHESGAGTSRLSREQCNHFGIKGTQASKKAKTGMAHKYAEFETDEASFLHFATFLTSRKFYKTLRGNPDPLQWLKALKRTGYAASSKWVARVNSIIRKYNLTAYDHPMTDTVKMAFPTGDTLKTQPQP